MEARPPTFSPLTSLLNYRQPLAILTFSVHYPFTNGLYFLLPIIRVFPPIRFRSRLKHSHLTVVLARMGSLFGQIMLFTGTHCFLIGELSPGFLEVLGMAYALIRFPLGRYVLVLSLLIAEVKVMAVGHDSVWSNLGWCRFPAGLSSSHRLAFIESETFGQIGYGLSRWGLVASYMIGTFVWPG